jgi:hypothetical protein
MSNYNTASHHKAVKQAIVLIYKKNGHSAPEKVLIFIENKLAEWNDSIQECCRRGLIDAPSILRLVQTYMSLDELDKRIRSATTGSMMPS